MNRRVYNKAKTLSIGHNEERNNEGLLEQAVAEFGSMNQGSFLALATSSVERTRTEEYAWRQTALKDGLIRGIISSHLVNAIGVPDNAHPNISVHINKETRENMVDNAIEFMNKEADKVIEKFQQTLQFVGKDALGYGDGYVAVRVKEGEGVTHVLYNLGTKPFAIVPYMSNFDNEDVGYEILSNQQQSVMSKSPMSFIKAFEYAEDGQEMFALRLNLNDGTLEVQDVSPRHMDALSPFTAEENYYQDSVHSGLLEGQKESYDKYIASIESSLSKRIASSIIERWITLSMNTTTKEERKALKVAMDNQLKAVDTHRKSKITDKDSSASVISHVIPTTGDSATGSTDIQESQLDFKDDMEDIMFHTKRLIGNLKFHPQLTAFSESQEGERSDDSIARNSEQMEEVGSQLRGAINELIFKLLDIHFYSLTGKRVDDIKSKFQVEYNSVVLQSTKEQEIQRIDTLNNQSQFNTMVTEFKEYGFKDDKESRELLHAMIKDSVPLTLRDSEQFLDDIISHIVSTPPAEDGEA